MTINLTSLAAARADMTPGEWHDRGRTISRVPDNTGMGATMCTNHLANFADREDCAGIVATHNAADVLIAIAKACVEWRNQRADNLMYALTATDEELDAMPKEMADARRAKTAGLARAIERLLTGVTL